MGDLDAVGLAKLLDAPGDVPAGFARRVGKGLALAYANSAPAEIDTGAMSASAIISTATPDRSGDVMVASGCRLENYRFNPVVFWEHQMDFRLPIAKSEDPAGNLTVQIGASEVKATSYFSQSLLEARQVFALVAEGIIRATSIQFDPLRAKERKSDRNPGYRSSLEVQEWDLLEWSWVGIPDNPEAIREVLSKNRLDGDPISEPIKKSLLQYCPPAPVIGKGWTETPEKKMAADENPTLATLPETEKKPETDPKNRITDAEPVETAIVEETEPSLLPLGAEVLAASHDGLKSLALDMEASLAKLENPEVKSYVEDLALQINGHAAELSERYSKQYPDAAPLDAMPESVPNEELVRGFLAKGRAAQLTLAGTEAQLKAIAGCKSFAPQHRDQLKRIAAQFAKLLASARTAADEAPILKAMDRVERLEKKLNEALSKLDAALPVV